jgi:2-polyprenyl-3-methyl-5-hydroxy-6-metoxy-1,4-benzoquinol methylase
VRIGEPGFLRRHARLPGDRGYYPSVTEPELPEHVARNRVYWDEVNAPLYAAPGTRAWARNEITWGIFSVPETELHALPADVAGLDVVELGCGTGYFGAWLARRGAHVTGSTTPPSS